jgi:CBS domain-containing protein
MIIQHHEMREVMICPGRVHLSQIRIMLNTQITELMTPTPRVVQSEDSLLRVKQIFEQQQFHHHLPVVDGNGLIGMISLYDFIIAMGGASLDDKEPVYASKKASEIMSRDLVSCTPESTLGDVLKLMLTHHVSGIPVVQGADLVGIVTSRDVLRWVSERG